MSESGVLNPEAFPHCFVCGPANPDGLGLTIRRDGHEAVASYTPRPTHEGYPGRFHGGLVGLLVDEMLVYAGAARGLWGMTAKVGYRLRLPIAMDAELALRGRVTRESSRGYFAEVEIRLPDGRVAAEGDGMCVITDAFDPQRAEESP